MLLGERRAAKQKPVDMSIQSDSPKGGSGNLVISLRCLPDSGDAVATSCCEQRGCGKERLPLRACLWSRSERRHVAFWAPVG